MTRCRPLYIVSIGIGAYLRPQRVVAQGLAHLVRDQGVGGSNPLCPIFSISVGIHKTTGLSSGRFSFFPPWHPCPRAYQAGSWFLIIHILFLRQYKSLAIVFPMKTTGKTSILFFSIICACFLGTIAVRPLDAQDPLLTIVIITILNAGVSFLFGLLTHDYSWTDRLWSTAPVGYAWIYASAGSFKPAITLAAILVSLWGLRLTYNFARRQGYTGGEDYRWPILRGRIGNNVLWQVFNLFFIAFYQQFLFICFTLPLYTLVKGEVGEITPGIIGSSMLMLAFLALETIADQQQYEFQQSKYHLLPRQEALQADYQRGFRTTGLFAWSRHPNYLGELGVWWSIYLMGACAMQNPLHWSLVGPFLLTLLFIGSTWFTEGITVEKYPAYQEYRKQVWPIFPKPRLPQPEVENSNCL